MNAGTPATCWRQSKRKLNGWCGTPFQGRPRDGWVVDIGTVKRFWNAVAHVVTYGFYVVMWVVFGFFIWVAITQSWVSKEGAETNSDVLWNGFLLIAAFGLSRFAVKGFTDWSKPTRDRLYEERVALDE